jgi:hypothetical protein
VEWQKFPRIANWGTEIGKGSESFRSRSQNLTIGAAGCGAMCNDRFLLRKQTGARNGEGL